MHEIVRRMWDRDLTLRKWSVMNGFNWRYVQLIILGKRGQWNVGVGKKIQNALVNQRLASRDELQGGDR